MKTTVRFWGSCFRKVATQSVILGLLALISCKKESILSSILGDYYTQFNTNTFPQSCPNGTTLYDVGERFTIKKSGSNLPNNIEILWDVANSSIWYGELKSDTLFFPKQVVNRTNSDYIPKFNQIKGIATVRENIIVFQIEEFYFSSGVTQFCTFTATKR